jgi:hypothetical protein
MRKAIAGEIAAHALVHLQIFDLSSTQSGKFSLTFQTTTSQNE